MNHTSSDRSSDSLSPDAPRTLAPAVASALNHGLKDRLASRDESHSSSGSAEQGGQGGEGGEGGTGGKGGHHGPVLGGGIGREIGGVMELNELAQKLSEIRAGRTVVHCHGVFDLLHIGHIRHLQEARQMGDILVVTLTPDRFVNKGPGRPAFPELLRAEAIAALDCVDLVAINHWPMAIETIRLLKPDLYVKGPDYKDQAKDSTGGIGLEEEAVQSVGGKLAVTDDITFSSSNLINRHLSALPPKTRDYLREFAQRHPIDDVVRPLNNARPMRVLAIGEAILDHYVYCSALGKSSKEPVLAVQRKSQEMFAGGILAVANHLAGFCDEVRLVGMLGVENRQEDFIRQSLRPQVRPTFVVRQDGPTVLKRRYIEGYFFQKLFEVYEFNDAPLSGDDEKQLLETLEPQLAWADVVVLVDFGHGMMTPAARRLVCEKAKFLTVNTQSNAGNFGCHSVSKYPRADLICLAENEMRLEARDRHGDILPMVKDVAERLGGCRVIVTRGANGCLPYDGRPSMKAEGADGAGEVGLGEGGGRGGGGVPAVAGQVKDRMGAGDTFLSVATLAVAQGADLEVAALLGNAAGASAVATVGHRTFLDRVSLIRQVECLLK